MSGQVLVLDPDLSVQVADWPDTGDTLRLMYRLIDCSTVELVRLKDMWIGPVDMWIDEEGKFVSDPEINRLATMLAWRAGAISSDDMIVGKVMFASSNGPETVGFKSDELNWLRAFFSALTG